MNYFEKMMNELLLECERLGRTPTKEEITRNPRLLAPNNLRQLFKKHGYNSYLDYCIENGYKKKQPNKTKFLVENMTYDELCIIFDQFFLERGYYPNSIDCKESNGLPHWPKIKKICGERYREFLDQYGLSLKQKVNEMSYEEICDRFIELSNEKGRPLYRKEIDEGYNGVLPSFKTILKKCPDKNIKTIDDFVFSLGFKPKWHIPKEYAIEAIYRKAKELDRTLFYDDFRNPQDNEIGIATINRIWGTFNNMLVDLGFEINQQNMRERIKTDEELLNDLQRAIDETGKIPKQREIIYYPYMASQAVYHNRFKGLNNAVLALGYKPNKTFKAFKLETNEIIDQYKEFFGKFKDGKAPSFDVCKNINNLVPPITLLRRLNCTWNEFVESLGYFPNEGRANYQYANDGTLCYSTGESFIHNYLLSRTEIEIMGKEVLYVDIIDDCNLYPTIGLKRLDWMIKINGVTFFVEYFGYEGNFEYDERTKVKKQVIKADGKEPFFIGLQTSDIKHLEQIIDKYVILANQ